MQARRDTADLVGMTDMRRDGGFTLVELLVVIVIIGVLAAIAIPGFLGQKQKGYRAAVVSDARSLMTAQASRLADQANYTEDVSALETGGFRPSGGVDVPVIKVVGNTYTACVKHSELAEWLILDGTDQVTAWAATNSACV